MQLCDVNNMIFFSFFLFLALIFGVIKMHVDKYVITGGGGYFGFRYVIIKLQLINHIDMFKIKVIFFRPK